MNSQQRLKPEERDIGKWIKAGWGEFQGFVGKVEGRVSGKEQKKADKDESIRVHEDEKFLVVIPLSSKASCFYGANTRWCTAGSNDNMFDSYFNDNGVTMFYIINKKNGEKFAVAMNADDHYECFDAQDRGMSMADITAETGFDLQHFTNWLEKYDSDGTTARSKAKFTKEIELAREHIMAALRYQHMRVPYLEKNLVTPAQMLRRHLAGKNIGPDLDSYRLEVQQIEFQLNVVLKSLRNDVNKWVTSDRIKSELKPVLDQIEDFIADVELTKKSCQKLLKDTE